METIDTTNDTFEDEDLYSSPEEFNLYVKDVERTAANLAHLMGMEQQPNAIDDIVFSLRQSLADTNAGNPVDFSDMLTTNSRILNAAFEFYLDKAKDARSPDEKIALALRAQSQLIRTINTWKRIATPHIGGTK